MIESNGLLTRLNIGGQSYEFKQPSRPNFTREELAAVLGMGELSKNAYRFALAYYMHDESARMDLERQLWIELAGHANVNKWKVIKGRETLRMLCRMAIAEWLVRRPCRLCGGEDTNCVLCGGSGIKLLTGRQQAAFVGMSQTRWAETWRERYSVPFGWVRGLAMGLDEHIRRHYANNPQ